MHPQHQNKNSTKIPDGYTLNTSPVFGRRSAEKHLHSHNAAKTANVGGHCQLIKQRGLQPKN